MSVEVLLGGPAWPVFKNVDHSVAFPPVEKFHNLKPPKYGVLAQEELETMLEYYTVDM